MRYFLPIIFGLVVLSANTAVLSAELVKQGNYDIEVCWGGTTKAIAHTKSHVAANFLATGVARSKKMGGFLDMSSFQCVGVLRMFSGDITGDAICEFIDADGDNTLFQIDRRNKAGGVWTLVSGTGKFAGISGGGPYKYAGQFPTARQGRFQGCAEATGSYTIP